MNIPTGFALPLPTQGYRWNGFYRSEMKRTGSGNRYTAKCKHCLVELSGKPDRLHQHVLRCNDWPASEKTAYIQKISEETHASRKRTCDNDNTSVEQTNEQVNDDTEQWSSTSKPHQENILSWCTRTLSQAQLEYFHQKLLKIIIHGNLTFRFVENPYLQDFLQELNPSYHLPSRDMVKGRLLTKMFSNHVQEKLSTLSSFTDLTISLDG